MIPEAIFTENLSLASQIAHVPGCVVECGVWRGGMSAGLADVLGPDRAYYLCDSFEGLPSAKPIDGASAIAWQNNTTAPNYYDNCTAPESYSEQAMRASKATSFRLIKGWFHETLPNIALDSPIALLRLDGDWYDSTMACLDSLYDKVTEGGIIIIDDYYAWDGCSRALHDFLSKRSAEDRIQNQSGVCFIKKKSSTALASQKP